MSDDIHDALRRAVSHSTDYLDALEGSRVGATASAGDLRRRLGRPLGERGVPAERVILL